MNRLFQTFRDFRFRIQGGIFFKDNSLFVGILLLGVFARIWGFGKLPSGLISDEASIAVDAFSLLHFGIDHNGVSFPIHFISFGSGQNALYGYVLIPFIALFGLNSIIVKLPMLISGLLTLPLVYWVTRQIFNKRMALISMFFLAISPWHIMLSRIGLESNLLPFVFLAGFACLIKSLKNEKWFLAVGTILAVCLYSYVTAYLTIPFFLACSLVILWRARRISLRYLAGGLACFIVVAIPIGLFVLINLFGFNSIRQGPVTIPHLPTQPRFESQTGALVSQLPQTLILNSWILIKLLVSQDDGVIYNTLAPYGYLYGITFPLVIFGVVLLFIYRKTNNTAEIGLLLAWLAAPLILGILQPANINRINMIFIPMIICVAVAVEWLEHKIKHLLPIALCCFSIAFIFFTVAYHGATYRAMIDSKFHAGLLSAIQYASAATAGPICVTDRIDMPYIFVLFVEKPDPAIYLTTVRYKDAAGPYQQVESLLRYTFGKQFCADQPRTVYLLRYDDGLPRTGSNYRVEVFGEYHVFIPKP